MSIVAFKKKSIIQYGSKRSGNRGPPETWITRGPFGRGDLHYGFGDGFSLNGTQRSISVGKDMKYSKSGTPFRGIYPIGNGGCCGTYKKDVCMNVSEAGVLVDGSQEYFVKPSVLNTKSMLREKYKYLYNGVYPNYWVKPIYTSGALAQTSSEGLYVEMKSSANDCVVDVNDTAKYVGHVVKCGPTDCSTTPARGYKMVVQSRNAPYTKTIGQPITSGQYTLRIQRRCAAPLPWQKPYPPAVNGDGSPCAL